MPPEQTTGPPAGGIRGAQVGGGQVGGGTLPEGLSADVLAAAEAESDPTGLAAATRLRGEWGPEAATAAISQVMLRRRGRIKFGDAAAAMFFTRDGLEQATRPAVADQHAARLVAAGAKTVLDLGCGIGSDALAFARAGLRVVAVDCDPATAAIAAANLSGFEAEVLLADAEQVLEERLATVDAVFCDPARRTGAGRTWRVEDFTPPWSLVTRLLDGRRPAGVKLGPALPHRMIPPGIEAEWVSDRQQTVEVGLWSGSGAVPDRRSALIMPGERLAAESLSAAVAPIGRYLYEPDGAVIRAGSIAALADRLGAGVVDPQIAYLSSDTLVPTPFAVAFEILESLPYKEKVLRRWLRDHEVGRLEIKRRGVDVDPAELRKRLRPDGTGSATLIITRTPVGTRVLVAERRP